MAVQRRENRVQGGTFTGTRWPGDQDNAVRAVNQPL